VADSLYFDMVVLIMDEKDTQQFLPPAANDLVRIIVDERESEIFDEEFKKRGALVERRVLLIGDFLCSERLVVERKTRDDFEASIIDGRLFSQLTNLVENYERAVLIVEGEQSCGRIRKEALLGAYASVLADYGVSLFFTRDQLATVDLVFALAKHEQFGQKRPLRIYAKRKTLTLAQTQRAIVEMFPMIGPKSAKALLEHFGNIENIVNASEKELRAVEGIGGKRAKVLKSVLVSKYESEKDPL
jgi:Fanconi anemia group M protein